MLGKRLIKKSDPAQRALRRYKKKSDTDLPGLEPSDVSLTRDKQIGPAAKPNRDDD
jgi:hypothetical protein